MQQPNRNGLKVSSSWDYQGYKFLFYKLLYAIKPVKHNLNYLMVEPGVGHIGRGVDVDVRGGDELNNALQ